MTTFVPSLSVVEQGFVAPCTYFALAQNGQRGHFDGGVYTSDGEVVAAGLQEKLQYDNRPAPLELDTSTPSLAGRHLFGGLLQTGHFGHFMVESISRLWGMRYTENIDSVVYYARRLGAPTPRYARAMLDALDIHVPITVVTKPTRFEETIIPSQAARPRTGYAWGHPVNRRLAKPLREIPAAPHKWVYVSRAGLKDSDGGYLLEGVLEQNLREQGYFIMRPETLSLEDQFSIYSGAQRLIFSDGSALHVYALVARPDQETLIVWRRKPSDIFISQIQSFAGRKPVSITSHTALWVPGEGFGALAHARAQLDFAALRDLLRSNGFIGDGPWEVPSDADISRELDRISLSTGKTYGIYERMEDNV